MERSNTHGPSCRRKSHNTYPINENLRSKIKNPYYKNQEYIQTNKHTCCIICTFYTSPYVKTKESTTCHKPPNFAMNKLTKK